MVSSSACHAEGQGFKSPMSRLRSVGQMVKLSPSQGGDMGSIPIQTTVAVVQLVRTSDCGSEGREFESLLSHLRYVESTCLSYLDGNKTLSGYPNLSPQLATWERQATC